MNFTNKLIKRTSIREFTNEKMSEKTLQKIIDVINNAPSSHNMQQFSAIIITDQKIKDFISKNNFNQKHIRESALFILFIGDRSRLNYVLNKHQIKTDKNYQNHEFLRMVIDTVIAATQAHDALINLGYGVTFVGGILNFLDKINKVLNIPNSALPIVGLSIGKPAKINQVKPKMNKVFFNKYNHQLAVDQIEKYSIATKKYFKNMPDKINFIEQIVKFLTNEEFTKKWIDSSIQIEKIKRNI